MPTAAEAAEDAITVTRSPTAAATLSLAADVVHSPPLHHGPMVSGHNSCVHTHAYLRRSHILLPLLFLRGSTRERAAYAACLRWKPTRARHQASEPRCRSSHTPRIRAPTGGPGGRGLRPRNWPRQVLRGDVTQQHGAHGLMHASKHEVRAAEGRLHARVGERRLHHSVRRRDKQRHARRVRLGRDLPEHLQRRGVDGGYGREAEHEGVPLQAMRCARAARVVVSVARAAPRGSRGLVALWRWWTARRDAAPRRHPRSVAQRRRCHG